MSKVQKGNFEYRMPVKNTSLIVNEIKQLQPQVYFVQDAIASIEIIVTIQS